MLPIISSTCIHIHIHINIYHFKYMQSNCNIKSLHSLKQPHTYSDTQTHTHTHNMANKKQKLDTQQQHHVTLIDEDMDTSPTTSTSIPIPSSTVRQCTHTQCWCYPTTFTYTRHNCRHHIVVSAYLLTWTQSMWVRVCAMQTLVEVSSPHAFAILVWNSKRDGWNNNTTHDQLLHQINMESLNIILAGMHCICRQTNCAHNQQKHTQAHGA